MFFTSEKLQSCITSMRQHFNKSGTELITNRVYKFGDIYIINNKSKKSLCIELENSPTPIFADEKFIFLPVKPVDITVVELKIIDACPQQVMTNSFDVSVLELPQKLISEFIAAKYIVLNDKYLFGYTLDEISTDIKFNQDGLNVEIYFENEVIRKIMNAELSGNLILCNSWSVVDLVIKEAIDKALTIESNRNQSENRALWDAHEDISDNIISAKNLDKRKLRIALLKIVKEIQSGKFKKEV